METPHESKFSNEFNSTKSNGTGNNSNNDDKAVAAANLIKTLDTALSEMSHLSTNAARNVEDARRTAREASEVARRYTARSYYSTSSTTSLSNHENGFTTTRANKKERNQDTMEDANTTQKRQHESSSERLARSHAQDVLSLSLELERTKQALQQECMAHDATRSTLSQARAQQTILTAQLEQVQQQHGSQLQIKEETIVQVQQELQTARDEKRAAEDDAQLALDLAMGNAESREQLESWLERALQEVQVLRGQFLLSTSHYSLYPPAAGATSTTTTTSMAQQPQQQQQDYYSSSNSNQDESTTTTRRSVRFAESPTVLNDNDEQEDNDKDISSTSSPRRLVASRSMVAAGRHLLHRATTENNKNHDEISQAPLQSAKRLRQRLLALNKNNNKTNENTSSRAIVVSCDSSCLTTRNIIGLLQSCATRLGIKLTIQHKGNPNANAQVESVARQFCNSVESKLNQQKDDIQELQSLCEYLEHKLLVGTGDDKI